MDKLNAMVGRKQKRLDRIWANMDEFQATMEDETIILDITDDMYCGFLSYDVIQEFTCIVCCGIVIDPVKCNTCSNLVCRKCVDSKKLKEGNLECYKKCGSRKMGDLLPAEQRVYNSLLFRCQNDDCTDRIPLLQYRSHMQHKCKVQTFPRVVMPQGATNLYDNNGNMLANADNASDIFRV